jgi:hypothetical protein
VRNLGRKSRAWRFDALRDARVEKLGGELLIDGVRVLASALVAKAFSDGFAVSPLVKLGFKV